MVAAVRRKFNNEMVWFFRNYFRGWNAFEITLLILSFVLPITLGVVFEAGVIDIAASVVACVAAVFFAKAKIEAYFLSFLMAVFYSISMFGLGLYGEVLIQLAIVFPLELFGVICWFRSRKKGKGKTIEIKRTSNREITLLVLSQVVMGVGYFYLLRAFGTAELIVSTIAVVTAVIGNYLMARRSHFGTGGLLLNSMSQVALASIMVSHGFTAAVPMLVMAIMFCVIDFYGMFNWARLRRRQLADKKLLRAKGQLTPLYLENQTKPELVS